MCRYLIYALYALFFGSASLLNASVSLSFSALPYQGIADGFGDKGVDGQQSKAVNDMAWAIVVLTTLDENETFDGLRDLNPFDINVSGQYLDAEQKYWYLFGGDGQSGANVPRTVDRGIGGALASLHAVDISITLTVGDEEYEYLMNGHRFAIVWFPEDSAAPNSSYGYLEDPGFILPNDGVSGDYYGLPVFQQNEVFRATETIAAVPEPAILALMIGGMACLAVIRRHRSRLG